MGLDLDRIEKDMGYLRKILKAIGIKQNSKWIWALVLAVGGFFGYNLESETNVAKRVIVFLGSTVGLCECTEGQTPVEPLPEPTPAPTPEPTPVPVPPEEPPVVVEPTPELPPEVHPEPTPKPEPPPVKPDTPIEPKPTPTPKPNDGKVWVRP